MRLSFQRGKAAFLLTLVMAVTSSAKPWYFNWMVPLIPYEKALRAQVVQKWHHLPYPLLAMQWHGIGKDTLPQGPIATCGRLESWWETILVCHLLQHRGNKTLYPTRALHWSWPQWPWCRQAYLAITSKRTDTMISPPPRLHCGGLGEGQMTSSCPVTVERAGPKIARVR